MKTVKRTCHIFHKDHVSSLISSCILAHTLFIQSSHSEASFTVTVTDMFSNVWVCIAVLWYYHWNVFCPQNGATALFIASQNGHLPIVKHLVAAKADVNTPMKVSYLIYYIQYIFLLCILCHHGNEDPIYSNWGRWSWGIVLSLQGLADPSACLSLVYTPLPPLSYAIPYFWV